MVVGDHQPSGDEEPIGGSSVASASAMLLDHDMLDVDSGDAEQRRLSAAATS
jgi:hypothetical protein